MDKGCSISKDNLDEKLNTCRTIPCPNPKLSGFSQT